MERTSKRVIACFLTLTLMLSLCACAQMEQIWAGTDEPDISVDRETSPGNPDKKPPDKLHPWAGGSDVQPAQAGFSAEAEQSLIWLRDRMDFPQTMFGVALLGYTGETSDGDWLAEADQAMLQKYPFISEIDAEHTIGNDDYLYCLVPIDENATVSVNLMRYDPESYNEEVIEVLYRSESGDPVLIFAPGGDDAYAYLSYIQVQIVDNAGNSCVWDPQLYTATGQIVPCFSETGDYLSFDFTEYGWLGASSELAPWLADGWSGPIASQLAGTKEVSLGGICWTRQATEEETGRSGTVSLWFFPDDEMGGPAELDWTYDGSDYYDKIWIGSWTIKTVMDGPSYLILTLCEDDKNYGVYLTETYPILISPNGMELVIGEGMNGINLPFMPEKDTGVYFLTMLE